LLAGRATFERRDDIQALEPGDLVLVRPFVPHSFRFVGRNVEHVAIHFDLAPEVPPFTGDPRRRRPYEIRLGNTLRLPAFSSAKRSPWARQSALRMLEEWTHGSVLDGLAARAELLLILVKLARLSTEGTDLGEPERLDSGAEAAVRRALAETSRFASVGDLARAAGLSASHLRRVVRGWVGQSPSAYLRQQQVSRARKLLADPRRSIKSVAFEAGFASPHHFSRVFRRIDGLSPSEYRTAILAGIVIDTE
jgi:AraC-like DNA-binding protein